MIVSLWDNAIKHEGRRQMRPFVTLTGRHCRGSAAHRREREGERDEVGDTSFSSPHLLVPRAPRMSPTSKHYVSIMSFSVVHKSLSLMLRCRVFVFFFHSSKVLGQLGSVEWKDV